MDYIKSLAKNKSDTGQCFLCHAAAANDPAAKADALVLWQSDWMVVMLNRYPYANGHLLIAPRQHKSELEEFTAVEIADLGTQTTRAVVLLKKAVSAQGFNIGINLGRVAGAGMPGHLHQHIVPRWSGDINFMEMVGKIAVVPATNQQMYEELIKG
jgi:ATP adenylyltransferase